MNSSANERPTLYSIGHSNHTAERFIELLRAHRIDVLVDVRSQPSSKFNPQFNQRNLEGALGEAGLKYLFMGEQLGGRPDDEQYLDEDGRALYHSMVDAPAFQAGIERLERGVRGHRVAIMCSEENPAVCHRHLLVSRVMAERGVFVQHIRGDGSLQTEEDIRPAQRQSMLFADMEQDSWKSLRSVSPKPARPSSSES